MSDNVYADLGFEHPEEMLAKAAIVSQIGEIIRSKGLNQSEAARQLGISQPKVSDLLKGRFQGYSLDRLLRFVNRLDRQVEIKIGSTDMMQAQTVVYTASVQ